MARLPARILEHPVESAVASLLLLALLFGSADFAPAPAGQPAPVAMQAAAK
jgi:hypothetical protein